MTDHIIEETNVQGNKVNPQKVQAEITDLASTASPQKSQQLLLSTKVVWCFTPKVTHGMLEFEKKHNAAPAIFPEIV